MVQRIHTKLRKRVEEQSENFNKERENIRTYQLEVTKKKNSIIKLKNKMEGYINN